MISCSTIYLAIQGDYSRWMEERGETPSFWDVAGFPSGFEHFCDESPPSLFNIRIHVFEALQK
jgi:hypothetical protein